MEWWQILIIAVLSSIVVVLATAFIAWRMISQRTRKLAARVGRLPWSAKLQLAGRLMRDERIPVLLRLIPPILVLYLALPIDLIPDFIPVIGQIDDILVVAVGVALLVRLAPMRVFDEHLLELEAIDADVRDVTEPPLALPGPLRP
jgi:uncharacterized membrane protein YkvA (DUF1232 family)